MEILLQLWICITPIKNKQTKNQNHPKNQNSHQKNPKPQNQKLLIWASLMVGLDSIFTEEHKTKFCFSCWNTWELYLHS